MVKHPYETVSDSFYFVKNELVMHNKAYYKYFIPEGESRGKAHDSSPKLSRRESKLEAKEEEPIAKASTPTRHK